jgi:hypothetical protein
MLFELYVKLSCMGTPPIREVAAYVTDLVDWFLVWLLSVVTSQAKTDLPVGHRQLLSYPTSCR